MAELEPTDEEIEQWQLAHRQLSDAVSEATQRVEIERMKRRTLLEAICTNITTEGKLASSSKWKVAPIFQPVLKTTKSKAKKTKVSIKNGVPSENKNSKMSSKTIDVEEVKSEKGQSTEVSKKTKPKAKPRLKVKIKPNSKAQVENRSSKVATEDVTHFGKISKSASQGDGDAGNEKKTENESEKQQASQIDAAATAAAVASLTTQLPQSLQNFQNMAGHLISDSLLQQQHQQIKQQQKQIDEIQHIFAEQQQQQQAYQQQVSQAQKQQIEQMQRQNFGLEQQQQQHAYHGNGMMPINFYHHTPESYMVCSYFIKYVDKCFSFTYCFLFVFIHFLLSESAI